MSLKKYTLNTAKLEEGEWVEIPDDEDGLKLFLRSQRCKAYQKKYSRLLQRNARMMRGRTIDVDGLAKLERACVAEYCLLGWDNLIDPDTGEQIPYSVEFSKQLMLEDDYQLFRELVMEQLRYINEGYSEFEEDTVKN